MGGCLGLSFIGVVMFAWAVEAGILLRDGHWVLAIILLLTWPLGLNVVMGTTVWIGSMLQGRDSP